MILWSDDCLACLCGFPHSAEEHMQAVQTAQTELQEQRETLRREYQLDEDWFDFDPDE